MKKCALLFIQFVFVCASRSLGLPTVTDVTTTATTSSRATTTPVWSTTTRTTTTMFEMDANPPRPSVGLRSTTVTTMMATTTTLDNGKNRSGLVEGVVGVALRTDFTGSKFIWNHTEEDVQHTGGATYWPDSHGTAYADTISVMANEVAINATVQSGFDFGKNLSIMDYILGVSILLNLILIILVLDLSIILIVRELEDKVEPHRGPPMRLNNEV